MSIMTKDELNAKLINIDTMLRLLGNSVGDRILAWFLIVTALHFIAVLKLDTCYCNRSTVLKYYSGYGSLITTLRNSIAHIDNVEKIITSIEYLTSFKEDIDRELSQYLTADYVKYLSPIQLPLEV